MQVTIDKAGRLVIPKQIRDKAYIKPGMKLDIRVADGRIEIEPVPVPVKLERQGRFLVAVRRPAAPPLPADLIERERETRMREILGLDLDGDVPT
jgi:AbrB family looped-hinge helix DNA binding protein